MKYKFKWEDGKEFEFDPIKQSTGVNHLNLIYLELGEIQGRHRNAVRAIVSDADWLDYRNRYTAPLSTENREKIRVCRLHSKVSCLNFPAGTYLPYTHRDGYNPYIHITGLTGELNIHKNEKV